MIEKEQLGRTLKVRNSDNPYILGSIPEGIQIKSENKRKKKRGCYCYC